jgi:hypothetical protein
MHGSHTGGCACGAIRFSISGDPVAALHCQCRQCQRDSGTGHGSHLVFNCATVELQGTAGAWRQSGDGGTVKEKAFCPTCGTPVYISFPDNPDLFSVMAASLDEPERFQPQFVVWADAGQAWDYSDPSLSQSPRMPSPG